ncbi:MAG: SHOCT-like domain-containing protein [Steroidobacteraceae bacterium]
MNDDRRSILDMLAAGKITAEEAERLLAALEPNASTSTTGIANEVLPAKGKVRYLRVQVEADESTTGLKGGPTIVNVRVPLQLLRAGVRLAGLLPAQAHDQLNQAFSQHGIPISLSQIKPENLEEIIDHLEGLTVDVDGKDNNKARVRVFCE